MQQHGLALGVAAATLMLMAWGLGRPALWLDEAASVVATRRTWADLWGLLGGTEAPLVPYYALLKVTSSTVTTVGPVLAVSPEALVRWPSVVVTVLAAWALTLWLARRCPPGLAFGAAALLLVTVSFRGTRRRHGRTPSSWRRPWPPRSCGPGSSETDAADGSCSMPWLWPRSWRRMFWREASSWLT